jgi:uncharacterized surface protein with fasciclin (FAS1) repeats
MKKEILKRMNSRNLILTGFAALAIFLVSCEKYEGNPLSETAKQEDALKRAKAAGDAGKSKKAPAPGDLSIGAIAIDAATNEENPLYPQFTQLVAALLHVDEQLDAGLVDLFVSGKGQYTDITEVDAETVLDVLLYHVTKGRRASNSVVPPKMPRKIQTLLGESFMVTSDPMIDAIGSDANFVSLDLIDISASNGIIHVIDTVLLHF